MNEVDLVKKLTEINEMKKQTIQVLKQNIGIVNEIITNTLNAGEFLQDQNTINIFQMIPQKSILWNFLGDKRNVFFVKNNSWFDVTCENSSIYIGVPPNTIKIEPADDDILIEYIEYVLLNKKVILDKIDIKVENLKNTPEELLEFFNLIQTKMKKSG